MHLLYVLFIGLVIGALAKFIVPGKDPGGIFFTMILGIIGAFTATWIGQSMGFYLPGEPAGFIASVLGAVALLVLVKAIQGRRRL